MGNYTELIILVLAAAALLVAMSLGKSKGKSTRSAKLMKKYGELSPDELMQAPDEEKAEAVVCNVLAQASKSRRPNVLGVLADRPHGFTVVYSVWAVCKELAAGSYEDMLLTPTKEVEELAATAFADIGAKETAEAFGQLRQRYADGDGEEEAQRQFHRAVEKECPLTLCVEYIKDNPEQFLSDTTGGAEPTALQEPENPEEQV